MTGDEIIALARAEFGEGTAATVSTTTALDFLNAAIREIYEDIPPNRIPELLIEDTTVSLDATNGWVVREAAWDQLLEVYVDDVPALGVDRALIQNWDYSTLFQSAIPIFHFDGKNLWVRPFSGVTVNVLHTKKPTEITTVTSANEVTEIPDLYHTALADLVASYMYAQEEDVQQADTYRSNYQQKITNLHAQLEAARES